MKVNLKPNFPVYNLPSYQSSILMEILSRIQQKLESAQPQTVPLSLTPSALHCCQGLDQTFLDPIITNFQVDLETAHMLSLLIGFNANSHSGSIEPSCCS